MLLALADDHARFPRILESLLPIDDAGYLRQREAPGRWSPLEILVHLRDEEVEDFRARAQAAVEGRPLPSAIDPVGWVSARDYNRQDPKAVMSELARERALSCDWLRRVTPADLAGSLEHPSLGVMRAADFVAAWRMHDLLHLRQLVTALARLEAARLAGHRLEYAGAPA